MIFITKDSFEMIFSIKMHWKIFYYKNALANHFFNIKLRLPMIYTIKMQ